MRTNSRRRKFALHMKRIEPRKKSAIRQAVKALSVALIGTLATPSAVLAAQAPVKAPIILGEYIPPTDDHREPRHGMGGIPQVTQAVMGTSATTISIDVATPMADVFIVNSGIRAMESHYTIALGTAVRVLDESIGVLHSTPYDGRWRLIVAEG